MNPPTIKYYTLYSKVNQPHHLDILPTYHVQINYRIYNVYSKN